MTEADEQFARRLGEDLGPYLGPEITLASLELSDPDAPCARIRATCQFDGGTELLETDGETRLDAYNQLILRAAELRLVVAARHLDADALMGLSLAWKAGFSQEPR
jgi:hypothetical protein